MTELSHEVKVYAARVANKAGCKRADFTEEAMLLIEQSYYAGMDAEECAYMIASEVMPKPDYIEEE